MLVPCTRQASLFTDDKLMRTIEQSHDSSVYSQAFFKDQLSACRSNGMRLPDGVEPNYGVPPQIVVYSDPRNDFVGKTIEGAYRAGGNYFKKMPDIIFVILPERGQHSGLAS